MLIQQWQSASSPQLLLITKINNSIPKTRYILYYQIPIFPGQFRSIDDMQELLMNDNSIKFKILDLQMPDNQPTYKQANFSNNGTQLSLSVKVGDGELIIKAQAINRAEGTSIVFSLRVLDLQGYGNFLKFRQKYRTLQNLTRKQNFSLDHRLKIIDSTSNSTFYFSLQQDQTNSYFFTSRKLTVQLEQIYSLQDWQMVQTIFEDQLDLGKIDASVKTTINILQKFKITLGVQMIKNDNLSTCEMAVLRVLECQQTKSVTVGTDKAGQLSKIYPLLSNKFYDYQFGYLTQNLKQQALKQVYSNIQKLSRSFPKFPHLKNSQLLDIDGSKFITFDLEMMKQIEIANINVKKNGNKIIIPLVYVMKGFNVVENQFYKIKFYVQFDGKNSQVFTNKLEDIRRVYEVRIKDIWNLGKIAKDQEQFSIKIVSPGITYEIPFQSTQVDISSFRKQSKELQLKQQYSQLLDNKYYILTEPKDGNKNKLKLTKTQSINQFYIFDLFCSSSVNFQVAIGPSASDILMQGSIQRQKIIQTTKQGKELKVVLNSVTGFDKVVINLQLSQIGQKNQSLRTYYRIMYKLQFTDSIPCDNLYYSMEIKRLTDNRVHRAKLFPEISDDGISTLHSMEGGFFQSTIDDMELGLVLRKMHYNDETQAFDNSEVVNKKVVVNASSKQILEKNTMFLGIKEQGFNSLEFDFYDENVKKRLKLHLEIIMRKVPLLDAENGRYFLKVPALLWLQSNFGQLSEPLILQSHLSRRKSRGEKISLTADSSQECTFWQHNYKDSLSIKFGNSIGYDRIIDAIKVRCDVNNKQIGWLDDSQWYLGLINVGPYTFHFMIKWVFDPNAKNSEDESSDSERTASKNKSERSYSQKIDPLAKTVRNMDLLNLKKLKNNLILQGRHVTARYVQREQTIIAYNKKITELEQKITRNRNYQKQVTENTSSTTDNSKKNSTNFKKMAELYRSICQCGQKNPKYNGYCQQCLKKLRKKYETFMKEYKQLAYQYERKQFEKFNSKQKYLKAKNKLKMYKEKLKAGEDIDEDHFSAVVKNMENNDIKRQIQQAKIDIFRLEQERQKLEDSAFSRLGKLEDLIRIEDAQIWQSTSELTRLRHQLQELRTTINSQKKET